MYLGGHADTICKYHVIYIRDVNIHVFVSKGELKPICHSSATFCHLSRIRKMEWTQGGKIPHWSTYERQGQDGVQIRVDGSRCHFLCDIRLFFFEPHMFDNSFQRWFQSVFVKLLINANCFQKVQEKTSNSHLLSRVSTKCSFLDAVLVDSWAVYFSIVSPYVCDQEMSARCLTLAILALGRLGQQGDELEAVQAASWRPRLINKQK